MSGVPTYGFPAGFPGYKAVGFLGEGASGRVFKARQHSTGQFVAIKTPGPASTNDTRTWTRANQCLFQETQVLGMLHHAHVVRLIDMGIAADAMPFTVLEFLPGLTLRDHLRHKGRMSLLDTLSLMAQLLDVLA